MTQDQMFEELGIGQRDRANELLEMNAEEKKRRLHEDMDNFCAAKSLQPLDLLRYDIKSVCSEFSRFIGANADPAAIHTAILTYLKALYPNPKI
jgi:hypothetical protein